ncbi:hypothetical protein BH23CHL7_BH23CHL7_10200 [soil metagenome]
MTGESELAMPHQPRISGALRDAASDFFYNSWRLVPANAIWGAMLLALLVGASIWLPAIVLLVLLGLPVVGLYHMATLIVRGMGTSFSDFLAGIGRHLVPALALAAASALLAVVFTVNVFFGLEIGGVAGWVLSAFALYGNIALAMFLLAAWPLLTDPRRQELTVGRRLRLAALLIVARPGRMFGLMLVISIVLAISTFLFAALLTVSIAYIALVSTRYVLPAADRLEGRATAMLEP